MVALSLVLALVALSPSQSSSSSLAERRAEVRAAAAASRSPRALPAANVFAPRTRFSPASIPDGAGGHYVAWSEVRDGDTDLFLLRVTGSGAPASGWPTDGLVVCGATGEQAEAALFPDGANGVIAGWLDGRSGWLTFDAFAQRVDASGVPQWTANGVRVLPWDPTIGEIAAAPDGSGGIFVAWDQAGASDVDIFAVRYTGTGALASGWIANGNVICDATGDQAVPVVTGDGAGGAILVWDDGRDLVSHVYAQRVDGAGAAQWDPNGNQVDESVDGTREPTVCAAPGGNALVFWADDSGPVLGQKLNGAGELQWVPGGETLHDGTGPGAPDGDFVAIPDGLDGAIVTWVTFDMSTHGIQSQRINGSAAILWGIEGVSILSNSAQYPEGADFAADGSGGAVFAWSDFRNGFDHDVFAQKVSAAGVLGWTPNGQPVCTVGGEQDNPSIAPDGAGGVLVSWLDQRSFDTEIYSQHLNSAGAPQFAANGIAAYVNPGTQVGSATVQTADGGTLVVWNEKRNGQYDIRARKLNADGTPAGPAVMVCDAPGHQILAGGIEDGVGGAIVAWTNWTGGATDLYAQRINGSGAPVWTANGVAVCTAAGQQFSPNLASDGAGGAIVAWHDLRFGFGGDIYAQRVTAGGSALWTTNGVPVCTDGGPQGTPSLATDGLGGAIVAWSDLRTFQPFIYAQRLNNLGVAQWTGNGLPIADFSGTFFPAEVAGMVAGVANDAIVLIHDYAVDLMTFQLTSKLHVQRVDGMGSPQWGTTGTLVCDAASNILYERILEDGAGGAFVAWSDDRNSPFDIYAQRVDGAGAAQWDPNGNVACDAAGWQNLGGITRSGSDLLLAWADGRSGGYDAYAHRLSGAGNDVWTPDGEIVSDAVRGQFSVSIAPWRTASPERFYVSWTDNRAGNQRVVFAERLDSDGNSEWTLDGVTSAAISLAAAEADRERVKLAWYGPEPVSASVQRRTEATGWMAVGTAASDGSGLIRFEDRGIEPGVRYGYRLAIHESGAERFAGETWVQVPNDLALALDGLSPNPAAGDLVVAFTLPERDAATIELLDLAGRRVRSYRLTDLAPGRHTQKLGGERPAPGVYFLRLSQGGRSVTARGAVTR